MTPAEKPPRRFYATSVNSLGGPLEVYLSPEVDAYKARIQGLLRQARGMLKGDTCKLHEIADLIAAIDLELDGGKKV